MVFPLTLCYKVQEYTGITIKCYQCEKPRLVYAKTKASPQTIKLFKRETNNLLYTCGTSINELVCQPEKFDFHVRANFNCQIPVEALYYSASFQDCCCHYGSTQRLQTSKEAYPICTTCLTVHERKAVPKRKVPKNKKQ